MVAQPIFAPVDAFKLFRRWGSVTPQDAARAMAQFAESQEALYRAILNRRGDGLGLGDRFNTSDIGERDPASDAFLVDRPIKYLSAAGTFIEDRPTNPPLRIYAGVSEMRVDGVRFGATGDLYEWIGPLLADPSFCSVDNAFYFLRINNGTWEEGGTSGAGGGAIGINRSNSVDPAVAGSIASVIHSDDGTLTGTTNGNTITLSLSYTLFQRGPFIDTIPPLPPTPSASLILTRAYDGGAPTTEMTPTANGVGTIAPGPFPGLYAWVQQITYSDSTYQDTTGDLQDRVFSLELDAFGGVQGGAEEVITILTIATNEPG